MFIKLIVLSRKLYWFIFRPRRTGVKCLISYDGKILLIRNSYYPDIWTLPGGGVKSSEEPESAVKREVAEEIGLNLESVSLVGKYESDREYKKDVIHCFYSQLTSSQTLKTSKVEVISAEWFDQNSLPSNISKAVSNSLEMLKVDPVTKLKETNKEKIV